MASTRQLIAVASSEPGQVNSHCELASRSLCEWDVGSTRQASCRVCPATPSMLHELTLSRGRGGHATLKDGYRRSIFSGNAAGAASDIVSTARDVNLVFSKRRRAQQQLGARGRYEFREMNLPNRGKGFSSQQRCCWRHCVTEHGESQHRNPFGLAAELRHHVLGPEIHSEMSHASRGVV